MDYTMSKVPLEKAEERQILIFDLLDEEFALDISCVREVLRFQDIYLLPQAPDFIEGVINLRGHIIAVIDLRKRFNIKIIEDRTKACIMICKIKKFIVGLIVDKVKEVIVLSQENIQPTPAVISTQIDDCYISGIARIEERVIVILNLEEILTNEEITGLAGIKK